MRSRHRGFMVIVAVSMIAFVALALAVVMQTLAADARNSDELAQAAQLRQLLTAGELTARAMIEQNQLPESDSTVPVPLPRQLQDGGARLSLRMVSDGQNLTSHIDAKLSAQHHASGTIRWHRDGNSWQLASIDSDER